MKLGEALKTYRGGRTQREVAGATGLTVNYISLVEGGSRTPSVGVLAALAKLYGTQVWRIVKDAEEWKEEYTG